LKNTFRRDQSERESLLSAVEEHLSGGARFWTAVREITSEFLAIKEPKIEPSLCPNDSASSESIRIGVRNKHWLSHN